MATADLNQWTTYTERYRNGEWRARVFRDMILEDAHGFGRKPVVLDIGCGCGFDGAGDLQQTLAAAAGGYIGVEPDAEVPLGDYFTMTHRCFFEDAPLRPGSVDLAFAVMVLEHLPSPDAFWLKLQTVLADGGVFWGFTMDARHWFTHASLWMQRLRLKELYLQWLRGERGEDRYHNYPVYYRANRPEQVEPCLRPFASWEFINFSKPGELDYYLPRCLQPVASFLERRRMAHGRPGSVLAVRVTKGAALPPPA